MHQSSLSPALLLVFLYSLDLDKWIYDPPPESDDDINASLGFVLDPSSSQGLPGGNRSPSGGKGKKRKRTKAEKEEEEEMEKVRMCVCDPVKMCVVLSVNLVSTSSFLPASRAASSGSTEQPTLPETLL